MCETVGERSNGWQGWVDIPDPEECSPKGAWVDLTHTMTENMPRAAGLPQPRIRRFLEMPGDPANITEIQIPCHHGTHIDAPRHFINDGPAIEDIPIERLHGPGVVWKIHKGAAAVITAEDLEAARPRMRRGDIVLIDTDWARRIDSEEYEDHARLSDEASEWLVEQGAKLVGVDCTSPDMISRLRPEGFDWPVHKILLGHGVLIAEHVTNISGLAGERIEAMFLGVKIAQADGAPTRAIARPVH